MIIGLILHGRPTVMRRLLIRSKRRVLIASDYLERALAPGRASTRQSWQGATDRDRSRPLVPCREVVSRNRNERSGCSRVDTGNWARTGRDRSRPVRKSVVWTRPNSRRSLLSGVYARGSKRRSHQSALECVTVVDSTTLREGQL